MSFSPAFIEELRNRLSLSAVIGARVKLTRAGREHKGCCPFHNERTPSFYVNDEKQFYHCFGCGAHGDAVGFTMRFDNLSFPEAVETLAAQAGLIVPKDTPVEREKFDAQKRLYQLLDRATSWFEEQLHSPAGREGLSYLQGRGLSDDAIGRFRLGYAPADSRALLTKMASEGFSLEELVAVGLAKKSEDRNEHYSFFRNRVIFPVGDKRGRTIAFGARILGEGEPKYLNSPDHALFHKGALLYGLSRARAALSQGHPIVVVEGYMDVIALVEAGYTGAVAPLGTALTDEQIQILWKLLPPLEHRDGSRDYSPILCFDGDNAGLRAASRAVDRALPLLSAAQTLRIATIMGAKDPDDLIRKSGKSAFDAILKQAQPMIDVLWNLTLEGRSTRTPEDRSAFAFQLKRRVGQIKDASLQKLYLEEYKIRIDALFGWKPKNADARRATPSAEFRGARVPPQDRRRLREKILIVFMLNHPELFDEFGENFALADLRFDEFKTLRDTMVELLSQEQDALPTASELKRALIADTDPFTNHDTAALLDDLLSSTTFIGAAKAARADAPYAEARKGWLAIWRSFEQEKVESEYAKACALYREKETDENKRRMEAIKDRLFQFVSQADTD